MPYVDLIAEFREDVRKIAREEKVTKILKLCDDVRDYKLVDLGVQLEDQEGVYCCVYCRHDTFFVNPVFLIAFL